MAWINVAGPVEPMGFRRYGHSIRLPLAPGHKVRLGRAIVNALVNPQRSRPTLRRLVRVVLTSLRVHGFTDAEITTKLTMLIEEIALVHGLTGTSLVSGKPRWTDLTDRVVAWMALSGSD